MDIVQVLFAAVAAAVFLAVIVWAVYGYVQTQRLRRQFGSEYDRTVERAGGNQRRAESVLGDRVTRRKDLQLRSLSPEAQENYLRRWLQVQAEFVDRPDMAVQKAHSLLDEVMVERGYPAGEALEERIAVLSVDHPDVIEDYRFAHRLHRESVETGSTAVSTEEQRMALVHYRALFTRLLDAADPDRGTNADVTPETPGHQRKAS